MEATAKTKQSPKSGAALPSKEAQQECPIFLRKTYHMIDTCDPNVACWSEDGETFVVKNTDVFEKSVIPQFFKHSKFSSFVRQLNFYGFRKIKYADTIKIDPKLEAETANFWRFRHDKFLKGQPDLLVEIKRSNGQQPPMGSLPPEKPEDPVSLKSEVSTLKKRIEAMTKNIDELTSLVKKVTLKHEEEPVIKKEEDTVLGSKRKKVESTLNEILPDEAISSAMDLDEEFELMRGGLFPPMPSPGASRRETSEPSQISDTDFVDQLFTAFGSDDMGGILEDIPMPNQEVITAPQDNQSEQDNSPNPELMQRLSEALTLLPRDVQEMIVNRLIAAITNTDSLEKNVSAVCALADATTDARIPSGKALPAPVPPSPVMGARPQQEVSLSLAAATLAALLSHYGSTVKDKTCLQKELPPVIPIHA